jgi:four helix bundle protein
VPARFHNKAESTKMKVKSYTDLIAWQKAIALVTSIYAATRTFPKEEIYGLTSQMRRAAVSIPSNIAEGQGRGSTNEFIHFLGTAKGSLFELQTQVHSQKSWDISIKFRASCYSKAHMRSHEF